MNEHLDHNTPYKIEQFTKWGRVVTLHSPVTDEIEGGDVFSGLAENAIKAVNPQTGQQVSFNVDFVIKGAESLTMAFEMYDDEMRKAVQHAKTELTKPKIALPSGTTLPNAEGPNL